MYSLVQAVVHEASQLRQDLAALPPGSLSFREAGVLSRSYGEGEGGLEEEETPLCLCLGREECPRLFSLPSLTSTCTGGVAAFTLLLLAMAAPYWLGKLQYAWSFIASS